MPFDNAAERRALAQYSRRWGLAFSEADSMATAEAILAASATSYDLLLIDRELLGTAAASTHARLHRLPGGMGAAVLLLADAHMSGDEVAALGGRGCVVTPS